MNGSSFVLTKELLIIPGLDIRFMDARIADTILDIIPENSDQITYPDSIETCIKNACMKQDKLSLDILEIEICTTGKRDYDRKNELLQASIEK